MMITVLRHVRYNFIYSVNIDVLYSFARGPTECHPEEFLQGFRAREHPQIHYVLNCKYIVWTHTHICNLLYKWLFHIVLPYIIAVVFIFSFQHDSTLNSLQAALDVYNNLPPYAACQLFEFYQEYDG